MYQSLQCRSNEGDGELRGHKVKPARSQLEPPRVAVVDATSCEPCSRFLQILALHVQFKPHARVLVRMGNWTVVHDNLLLIGLLCTSRQAPPCLVKNEVSLIPVELV